MRTLLFLVSLFAMLLACKAPETDDAAARIVTLDEENALLREQLELRRQIAVLEQRLWATNCEFGTQVISCPAFPAIDATVLDVNEARNHVVLDKGLDAKVDVGYRFDVFRDSTYKGQVRVESVARWTCSGVILRQWNPITKGDSATTRL